MDYEMASADDLETAAHFIAARLQTSEHRVGSYLGRNSSAVRASLEELRDLPFPNAFVVARDGQDCVGFLGLDWVGSKNLAYILGPFATDDAWRSIADGLWQKLETILPASACELKLGCDSRNQNCVRFFEDRGFTNYSAEATLCLGRKQWKGYSGEAPFEDEAEYSSRNEEGFRKLHPAGVYYTADEILGFIGDAKKVFVASHHGEMIGYTYAEVQTEGGTVSVCFVNVSPSWRRKGVGRRLVGRALDWAFQDERIHTARVSVRPNNEPSLRMASSLGFIEEEVVLAFRKLLPSGA